MKKPLQGSAQQLVDIVCWATEQDPVAEWVPPIYPTIPEREREKSCFVIARSTKRFIQIPPTSLVKPTREQENEFRTLAQQWRNEVMFSSSAARSATHPAYQKMIKMGPSIIPLLLRELKEGGGHWFIALRTITGKNPIKPEDAGNVPKMIGAWIEWGHEEGYLQ